MKGLLWVVLILGTLIVIALTLNQYNEPKIIETVKTVVETVVDTVFTTTTDTLYITNTHVDSIYIYEGVEYSTVSMDTTIVDSLDNSVKLKISYNEFSQAFKIGYRMSIRDVTIYKHTLEVVNAQNTPLRGLCGILVNRYDNASVFGLSGGVRIYEKVDILLGVSMLNYGVIDTYSSHIGYYFSVVYSF
jgi:hypothetical protein